MNVRHCYPPQIMLSLIQFLIGQVTFFLQSKQRSLKTKTAKISYGVFTINEISTLIAFLEHVLQRQLFASRQISTISAGQTKRVLCSFSRFFTLILFISTGSLFQAGVHFSRLTSHRTSSYQQLKFIREYESVKKYIFTFPRFSLSFVTISIKISHSALPLPHPNASYYFVKKIQTISSFKLILTVTLQGQSISRLSHSLTLFLRLVEKGYISLQCRFI